MAAGPDGQDRCQDILAAGIHHPINSKYENNNFLNMPCRFDK